ncbi:MAG: protein TolR [Burkholderiales bacterium]|nr:protein TolR [Burkholderiales bacterium]
MRQRKFMNQINIVPYVDVMLVLLVIFMVTAPLVNPGLVDLPAVAKSAPLPQQVAPLEVLIKRDAGMLLRERAPGERPDRQVTMAELLAVVKERQAANPQQPVVISADKDVRYEAVMKVMDALQRQNVQRVGLMVRPASQ